MPARRPKTPPASSSNDRGGTALGLCFFAALWLLMAYRDAVVALAKPLVAGQEARGFALGFAMAVPTIAVACWHMLRETDAPVKWWAKAAARVAVFVSLLCLAMFAPITRRSGDLSAGSKAWNQRMARELPGVPMGVVVGGLSIIAVPALVFWLSVNRKVKPR